MISLILRILKQITNDKRLIGLILFAPLLLLSLIYLLLGNSNYKPVIAADLPSVMQSELVKQDCKVIKLDTEKIDKTLENRDADAAVYMKSNELTIKFFENDAVKTGLVTTAVKNAIKQLNPAASMNIEFIHGKTNQSLFDSMGYIMLGILSFFFVFIISGISFVRERTGGTLERFILSPIKRWQIVSGYTVAFGIVAAIQSIIILLYSMFVLKMNIGDKFLESVFVMILMALTAVSLGALVSIFSNNEFQIVQFIPIAVIPQIFFSGLIPLDTIPFGLGKLAYLMPVYYACSALKKLIIYGEGISSILNEILILAGLTVILSVLNTFALKRYRKI